LECEREGENEEEEESAVSLFYPVRDEWCYNPIEWNALMFLFQGSKESIDFLGDRIDIDIDIVETWTCGKTWNSGHFSHQWIEEAGVDAGPTIPNG
jgi:hypothetical protein